MVVMPKDLAKMSVFSKKTVPSLDLELIKEQSGSSAEAGSDFGLDLNRNNIGHRSGTHSSSSKQGETEHTCQEPLKVK